MISLSSSGWGSLQVVRPAEAAPRERPSSDAEDRSQDQHERDERARRARPAAVRRAAAVDGPTGAPAPPGRLDIYL
ncbi:hypothetical protein [Kineococcus sp. SYSU DK006]|uniref:hypothetical protein n=1 Tax=Kineococcus sp. SYSU DK006 TaxID=3383127 RepID=UPI003D7C7F45